MGPMEKAIAYTERPGGLALSIATFSGIALLAALLWEVASGYVILLFIPALALCFYQLVLTPIYGVRLAGGWWTVMTEEGDFVIASQDIAHLQIVDLGGVAKATLVLSDGSKLPIPSTLPAQPFDLIQAATAYGVPVRTL